MLAFAQEANAVRKDSDKMLSSSPQAKFNDQDHSGTCWITRSLSNVLEGDVLGKLFVQIQSRKRGYQQWPEGSSWMKFRRMHHTHLESMGFCIHDSMKLHEYETSSLTLRLRLSFYQGQSTQRQATSTDQVHTEITDSNGLIEKRTEMYGSSRRRSKHEKSMS